MKSLISLAGAIALVAGGFAMNRPEAPAEPPPPVVVAEVTPTPAPAMQGDQQAPAAPQGG